MTLKPLIGALVTGSLFCLAGCQASDTSYSAASDSPLAASAEPQSPETSKMASADQKIVQPAQSKKPVLTAKSAKGLPAAPAGLLSFESKSPVGTLSRTTLLSRRAASPLHRIATLQIDNANSTTLMDMAFNCGEQTYVYLYMDPDSRPVDAGKIQRVQALSDTQFTAFDRGEALQSLRFSGVDTIPPKEMENHKQIMRASCGA